MDCIRSLYFSSTFGPCTLFSGVKLMSGEGTNTDRDRVISITLSESEWQEFVSRQPQPVNWLRERIRDEVKTPPKGDNKNAA